MWILQSDQGGEAEPLTFRVLPDSVRTLGRATRSDFIARVPLVSRVHCRLTSGADGTLLVEDLDSTNGTFVNDRRIKRAVLVPGDRLRMGRLELTVKREDGTLGSLALPPAPAQHGDTAGSAATTAAEAPASRGRR